MKTSIATVSLSGALDEKLEAIAAARFAGVEIFENDLLSFAAPPREVRRIAVAGIDPAEVATCVDVLSRMSANLAAEFDSIPNTPAED